jgi:hypothetical protein
MIMNEAQKTTEFLFTKMKKLYPTFERPDEVDIMAWTEILSGYSQTDILDALKDYRKNVPYNNAPNPAKFKEYLPTREYTTPEQSNTYKLPTPSSLMDQDIQDGNCHHNLPTYEAAYKLIVQDWLADLIPADVYANANFPRNVELAWQNGLFNRFDEALKQCSQNKFGRPYQFESENDAKAQNLGDSSHSLRMTVNTQDDAVKTLSAHWRVA